MEIKSQLEKLYRDGVSDEQVAAQLRVSATTARRWRLGRCHPNYATIKLLNKIYKKEFSDGKNTEKKDLT